MSRRTAAVLAALVLVLLTGCSNRAERLYRRAEALFSQGQAAMAAQEYRRLALEQPRSALADDALYKLAYLHREEFNSPLQAVQTYEYLADKYPDSPYTDEALLNVMQIKGEDLKDIAGVRFTYRVITNRFADDPRTLTAAHLQLVRTLFACDKLKEADQEARALIQAHPEQTRPCAAAMLIRARIADKQGNRGDQAVKLYEQIVSRYPQTPSAVEAKRAIGWIYYGQRGQQMKQELLAKVRAARVLTGVPAPPAVNGLRLKPFACLSSLLAQQGVRATPEELLTVCGAAFDFAYDPDHASTPDLGRNVLATAAEQYGFGVNVWSAPSADASFASLVQALSQGRPAMIPLSSGGAWALVIGYKPAEERVYLLSAGRRSPEALSRQQFMSRWARSTTGHTDCVTGPYFQLALGQRLQTPAPATILRNTARRALEAANQRDGGRAATGLHAYEVLAEQIERKEDPSSKRSAVLRRWSTSALPQVIAERRAAARALTDLAAAAPSLAQNNALQAAEAYAELARAGQELRRTLLSLTNPATGAEPPPEATWSEATDLVRQMQQSEERALSHLSEIAR